MNKIRRGTGSGGKLDRAGKRQLFRQLAVNQVEICTVEQVLLLEPLVVELNDVVIFGVHDHNTPMARRLFHRQADSSEIQLERQPLRMRRQHLIGEDLKTGKTLLDSLGHLVENMVRERPAERNMKAVVHVGFVLPSL